MLPHRVSRDLKPFRKLIHAQSKLAFAQQLEQSFLPLTHGKRKTKILSRLTSHKISKTWNGTDGIDGVGAIKKLAQAM